MRAFGIQLLLFKLRSGLMCFAISLVMPRGFGMRAHCLLKSTNPNGSLASLRQQPMIETMHG